MINSNIVPLPRTAQTIANVIGRDATLALASKCKHQCIYIPLRDMADNHHIVRTIGRDLAEQLQQAFGGEIVSLPNCSSLSLAKRDAEIRAARLSGKAHAAIAQEFQLSSKQIQLILRPDLAQQQRQRMRQRRRAERTKFPRKTYSFG